MILAGILGSSENPQSQEANDALLTLNEMIDKWNTENLMIFSSSETEIPMNGSNFYTIGPTGNVIIPESLSNIDSCYFKYTNNGVNLYYSLKILTKEQFDAVSIPSSGSEIPDYVYFNFKHPNTEVFVNPITSKGAIVLNYNNKFQGFPTLDSEINFPSGYMKALRYGLATELALEYGVQLTGEIQQAAIGAKNTIKAINGTNKPQLMKIDSCLRLGRKFDIIKGE